MDNHHDRKDSNTTKSALDAGRALALELKPSPYGNRGRPYFIAQDASGMEHAVFVTEDEALLPTPVSDAGIARMHDLASFLAYWKEHALPHSRLYATMQPNIMFTGVIDEHVPKGAPAWRDHRVVYTPTHSKEWTSWRAQDHKHFASNEVLAYWIEDQLPDITHPPADAFMAMIVSFRVDESRYWNNEVKLSNGLADFSYKKIVSGSALDAAGGRVEIPEQFRIEIPVFEGIDAPRYPIEVRFRWRSREGSIAFWYEMVRPHKIVEKAFTDLLDRVREDATGQLLFGSAERE